MTKQMNNVTELNPSSFEAEVLRADLPVVVDFYADWCGPCKMLAPFLDQLAAEYQGRIKFVKVNVDVAVDLAARYEVTGVPTLAVFRNGELVDTVVGLLPPKALKSRLERGAFGTAQPAIVAPR